MGGRLRAKAPGKDDAASCRSLRADMTIKAETPFQCRSTRSKAQIVRRVCEALDAEYGRPRLGNPRRPLDDLFYVMISNRTAPAMVDRTFRALRRRFPRWDMLSRARVGSVARVLRSAGLSAKKAEQMCAIVHRLTKDFGRCTLAPLTGSSDEDAESYLTSLPGVSTKVALCVMMFTMGRFVLPVDSHVHRVSRRLGWLHTESRHRSHNALADLVPPHRRHAFHVGCILHGRRVCRPTEPACERCSLNRHCMLSAG